MGYLNEDGLARYDGLIKNWVTYKSGTVEGLEPLLNWQKTANAGAVACYPLPVSPLEPNVSFLFTEIPPVNGNKSPSNPSTIAGVDSLKVIKCGKNFLIPPYYNGIYRDSDLTVTPLDDGSIKVTKLVSTNNKYYNFIWETPVFRAGTTFIMSATQVSGTISGDMALQILNAETNSILKWQYMRYENIAYMLENNTKLRFRLYLNNASVCTDLILKPQVELGSTVTAYEQGEGTDYTIALGNTYYGGTLDVTTGVMTVTHVMVEPDSLSYDISSHPADTGDFQYTDTLGRTVTTDGTTLTISDTAGGQIVYNLATPETVQLSATQIYSLSQIDDYIPRLNTLYSDQQSIQVGYVKSPIQTEQELSNAIVSLGGNV